MNTTLVPKTTASPVAPATRPAGRRSPARRFAGVVAQPQTYRNIAYLLLGLPLGTVWFAALVSGWTVAASMLVVALVGIPMLWGMWFVTRAFANVERVTTNVLLGERLPMAPMASSARGNVWARLRSLSGDRDRWRELGYLALRFPAGVATFTAAVTALTTPLMVAYAPILARYRHDQPFGDWALSSRMQDIASSTWAWLLVPAGMVLLIVALHVLNALAAACGRWATAWLYAGEQRTITEP